MWCHDNLKELLRETNVPWKDLVKTVTYGEEDEVKGEDIKWPLVKRP